MKKLKLTEYLLYSAIIVCGVGIDQLTKLLASKYLSIITTQPIINGVLHLTYVENEGAAFGMLANHRWVFIAVSSLTVAALLFLIYSGYIRGRLYTLSVSLIISGGIGNMIDRLSLGYVVDFIDFRLINFAVFNAADSFVCVGAGLLIAALVAEIIREAKSKGKDNRE